jgi:EAL domain-containing protein (putative c-di-GMP-specific phosphodiesterase class I)
MGIMLAIDDFGIGYSSLSYLRQFPVSKLKIDRSFIQAVPENADDAAITAAIISMGKSLNLRVIAEGVENESQMEFLRRHECDEIQGYYYSKPVTLEELTRTLATTQSSPLWLPTGAPNLQTSVLGRKPIRSAADVWNR